MIPLHPKFIHFPIALIVTSVFFAFLAIVVKGKRDFFKEVFYWNILLATAGAIAATITGLIAENNLVHNNEIHEIMEVHQLFGFILTGGLIGISLWLMFRRSKMQIKEFIIIAVIVTTFSGMLSYSADLGGKMVYEKGAGIIPMEDIIKQMPHVHDNTQLNNDGHQH